MTYEIKTQRRVEFADTDMAGILHFSNYFRYMEATEHAFFRSFGQRVHVGEPDVWGWVRAAAACSFKAPLHYDDTVELHLLVREKRSKSIAYDVVFYKCTDDGAHTEVARGSLTVVCVAKRQDGTGIHAVAMPAAVDAAVEVAPPELLAAP